MNERTLQIYVGAMVLASLIVTSVLVLMFGELPKLLRGEYTITISFNQAPGVADGTPVRKSGILIGRVKKVEFAEDQHTVLVRAAIGDQWPIYSTETCRVQTNLLGDAFLDFMLDPNVQGPPEKITANTVIRGAKIPDPGQMLQDIGQDLPTTIVSVNQTSADLGVASKKLAITLEKLNGILDENRSGIRQAVNQTNDILAGTRNVIGDEKTQQQLRDALAELPGMIRDTHDAVLSMKTTVVAVNRNLQNLEGLTQPLGEKGPYLVTNLEKGTQKLDSLVSEMLLFTQALNNSQGTIGQLVHNPELYQHLNRASKNIDQITRDLDPILYDVRTITDRVARHPELIGVSGAIKGSSGIK